MSRFGMGVAAGKNEGNDAFTQILLHGQGANAGTVFTDSSAAARSFTRGGNTVTSTANSKFGGASLLFDGNGDYLTTPDAAALRAGTGDYTIDFWVYTTDPGSNAFASKGWVASGDFVAQVAASTGKLRIFQSGTQVLEQNSAFPSNQWAHVAIVRASGVVTIYINGVADGSAAGAQNLNSTLPFYVGGNPVTAVTSTDGYIDEFRFSVGVARWLSNFTPSSAAYD